MKKTTIISILGIIVVAGIIIGVTSNSDSTNQEDVVTSEFNKYVEDGGSYRCEVVQNIDVEGFENSVNGIVYIHDGMIRGNYSVQAQGINVDTSLIVRDGFVYSWNSFTPMGVKAVVSTGGEGDSETSTSGAFSWDANQIGEFDCNDWDVDMLEFEIPEDITFQEIN